MSKPLHFFSIICTLGFSFRGVRDSLTLVYEVQSLLSFVRRILSFLSLERETLILKRWLFSILVCYVILLIDVDDNTRSVVFNDLSLHDSCGTYIQLCLHLSNPSTNLTSLSALPF